MVVEELERELAWLEKNQEELVELSRLEDLRVRIEDEIAVHRAALNALDRRLERDVPQGPERDRLDAERRRQKQQLERLRRACREADVRVHDLEETVENGLNAYWGLTFKEGNENSRFGEQIEDYACLYTSRVSNFVFYSPMQYLRSLRAAMPHERLMLRISPYGDEHGGPVATSLGSKIQTSSFKRSTFDTLILAGGIAAPTPTPGLLNYLRSAFHRSRRIASICTGALVLAEAGLLDGRRATTHWYYAKEMQRRYPKIAVHEDRIAIEHDRARARPVKARHRAQQGRLAAARAADHRQDLAGNNFERDAVDSFMGRIMLREVAKLQDRSHFLTMVAQYGGRFRRSYRNGTTYTCGVPVRSDVYATNFPLRLNDG